MHFEISLVQQWPYSELPKFWNDSESHWDKWSNPTGQFWNMTQFGNQSFHWNLLRTQKVRYTVILYIKSTMLLDLKIWTSIHILYGVYPRWEKSIYTKTVGQKCLSISLFHLLDGIKLINWRLLCACHQDIMRSPKYINQSVKSNWLSFWKKALFYVSDGASKRKTYGCRSIWLTVCKFSRKFHSCFQKKR